MASRGAVLNSAIQKYRSKQLLDGLHARLQVTFYPRGLLDFAVYLDTSRLCSPLRKGLRPVLLAYDSELRSFLKKAQTELTGKKCGIIKPQGQKNDTYLDFGIPSSVITQRSWSFIGICETLTQKVLRGCRSYPRGTVRLQLRLQRIIHKVGKWILQFPRDPHLTGMQLFPWATWTSTAYKTGNWNSIPSASCHQAPVRLKQ